MGLFYTQSAADARQKKKGPVEVPVHLMKQQGCLACPLSEFDAKRNAPKLEPAPSSAARPLVYVVLPSPTEEEDRAAATGSDAIYDVLRAMLRASQLDKADVRYGYAVRCRALGDTRPGVREVTCCSKYLEEDIERSEPQLVIGVGDLPLRWATQATTGDAVWRGRYVPLRVRSHSCWYFQVQSAEYVAAKQRRREYDTEVLKVFRHDIKSAVARIETLPRAVVVTPEEAMRGVRWVEGKGEMDFDEVAYFLESALTTPRVGIDIETSALRPYGAEACLATCSVSTGRETLAFPVDHPNGWPPKLRRAINVLLYDFIVQSHEKVAHNLQFELEWFSVKYGAHIARATTWGDSMAAAHTLDERFGALNLGACTLQRFGFNVKALSNIDTSRIMQYPLAKVLPYNGMDSKWCLLSLEDYLDELQREPRLMQEYERKISLAPTLVRSQVRGIHVDLDFATQQLSVLNEERQRALRLLSHAVEVKKFEALKGRPFSPTSDDDVVVLVRDVMRRDEGQLEDGRYSCDESVLSSIPIEAGIAPAQVLALRAANKLAGTYIEPLLNQDPDKGKVLVYPDGLLHTIYNAMVAETGRLSSEDPNNQNWPKRKRKEIRGVIVTPDGTFVFVAVDYGQIEARVVGMVSGDKNLVDALWTDFDIHMHWAERVTQRYPSVKDWIVATFDVDWDAKGMKTLRQEMKNKWVFPQFFGASWRSCAANLHLPDDVARDMQTEFWDQFAGVKRWQNRTVQAYEKNLYVETLTGRRRRGALSLNQIINTPIQGTAADIVTDAMTRLSVDSEVLDRPQLQPPLNVHDDLTFYIPKVTLERDVEHIAFQMCNCPFDFVNVPLLVEVSVSRHRWSGLEEVGVYRSDVLGIHKR